MKPIMKLDGISDNGLRSYRMDLRNTLKTIELSDKLYRKIKHEIKQIDKELKSREHN